MCTGEPEIAVANSCELSPRHLCQTVIVVVSGVWQIYHLRAFFRSKKLN